MQPQRLTIAARTLALALLVLAALGAAGAALFVHSGFYDISAVEQHTRPVFALMDYAMRRSVKARIAELQVPELQDPQRIRRGAVQYRGHCIQCHGAPGVAPDAVAFGLTPAPANLVGTARTWSDAEMFWVVKNGIKMTGMPAWSYRLRDEEIWDVVAFVRASVGMSPQQYAALAAGLPRHADAIFHPAPADATPTAALGDVEAGRRATERYLCVTCHVIPGLVGADRHVGPPLNGIARRGYIGGVVVNTPDNMVRWLKDPRALDPLSAMPALGLSDQDARDIAAFMYTLDGVAAE
jgi:mono/diheme cytochrome c family protein